MHIVLPAVSADAPAIQRITWDIPQFTAEERDCVRELWHDYLKNGKESPYCFCVGKDQETDSIGGFACYGKHALTKSTYDLYWIAVDPLLQRSGVGSMLLYYVEEQVTKILGCRLMIETSSTPPYRSARRFYKRHHYVQEAVLRDFYAPGDHLLIYSKRLRNPKKQVQTDYFPSDFQKTPDLHIRWGQKRYY